MDQMFFPGYFDYLDYVRIEYSNQLCIPLSTEAFVLDAEVVSEYLGVPTYSTLTIHAFPIGNVFFFFLSVIIILA